MPQITYTFSAAGQAQVASAFRSISAAASSAASATKSSLKGIESAAKRTASKKRAATEAGASGEVAAEQKAAARRAAIDARISRQRAKNRLKRIRESRRAAQQEVRIAERAAAAKVRAEKNAARKIAASRQRLLAGAGRTALGAIAGVGAVATALVGTAARDSVRLQDMATRIAIKGSGSAGQRDAHGNIIQRTDPTALRKSFERTAVATGSTATGVAEGVSAFVTKTGELGKAKEFQDVMARVSVATGTEMSKLGDVAADLYQKFDVKTVDDMNAALSVLAVQGKRGAFEMEDLSKNASKLTAAAQFFGGGFKGIKGVEVLGGLTQIARQATPSGEEAATAVNALFTQLLTKSDAIKKATKADVFADKGKTRTRDFRQVLNDVIVGSGGNIADLSKIFGRRGIKAISPLVSRFNEAREAERVRQVKGGEAKDEGKIAAAGLAALTYALDNAIASTGAVAQINDDYAIATTTTAFKLSGAWESLKSVVGAQLTPVLLQVVEKFASLATNTNIVDGMVTVFVALAEAAELAIDALVSLGVVKKKTTTPGEQLKAEKDKLRRLESARASAQVQATANQEPLLEAAMANYGGRMTDEQARQFAQASAPVAKLDAEIAATKAAIDRVDAVANVTPEQLRAQDVTSKEDFIDRYMATNPQLSFAQKAGQLRSGATEEETKRAIASDIFDEVVEAGARGEGASTRTFMGAERFDPAQKQLVENLGTQVLSDQAGTGTLKLDTGSANKSLGDFAAAAARAIATIDAAAKASVADGG